MRKTILDTLMKEYFSNKEIFASFFNGILKDKINQIIPENLVEMNTESIDNFIKDKRIQNIVRHRDIIYSHAAKERMILGLENQSTIDKKMRFRIWIYDLLTIMNAKRRIDWLYSVVLYTGEKKWKSEVKKLPKNWQKSFDYVPMLVVQMRDNDYVFTNDNLQALFDIVQWIYKERFDKIFEKYDGIKIDQKTAMLIGKITKNERLEEIIEIEKGDVDMCNALKKWANESKQEGRIEGKIEGVLEQKIKTIKTMIANGLGLDVILKSGFTQDEINQSMQVK